jgi:hypothetical protein
MNRTAPEMLSSVDDVSKQCESLSRTMRVHRV